MDLKVSTGTFFCKHALVTSSTHWSKHKTQDPDSSTTPQNVRMSLFILNKIAEFNKEKL
jgi:hypothetical protein